MRNIPNEMCITDVRSWVYSAQKWENKKWTKNNISLNLKPVFQENVIDKSERGIWTEKAERDGRDKSVDERRDERRNEKTKKKNIVDNDYERQPRRRRRRSRLDEYVQKNKKKNKMLKMKKEEKTKTSSRWLEIVHCARAHTSMRRSLCTKWWRREQTTQRKL